MRPETFPHCEHCQPCSYPVHFSNCYRCLLSLWLRGGGGKIYESGAAIKAMLVPPCARPGSCAIHQRRT